MDVIKVPQERVELPNAKAVSLTVKVLAKYEQRVTVYNSEGGLMETFKGSKPGKGTPKEIHHSLKTYMVSEILLGFEYRKSRKDAWKPSRTKRNSGKSEIEHWIFIGSNDSGDDKDFDDATVRLSWSPF